MQEGLLAGLLPAAQLFGGKRGHSAMQLAVMRAHPPLGREHLVIGATESVILIGPGTWPSFAWRAAPSFGERDHVFCRCEERMLHVRNRRIVHLNRQGGMA